MLVPQILRFCLELKKRKKCFVQLDTLKNIWKYKSTAEITLFITFYKSGRQKEPSKTVSTPPLCSYQQGVDITT